MVGRIPINNLEVVRPFPRGQYGWSPVQLAARLGRGIGLVDLGHIGLDGAQVPVNPANERLVDDIGGDDVVFGVLSSGGDYGGNDGIFNVDLAFQISSMMQSTSSGVISYDIVVHLDIQDIVLNEVVGRGEAALGHVNVPFHVIGLARQQFFEELDVFFFLGALEEDDAVEKTSVLGQIALLFPPSRVSMLILIWPSRGLRAVPLSNSPGLRRWSDGRKR